MTRRVLLRCDSMGDLYPVTAPSLIPHAFLVSQHTWHQHLGHPGSDVLRRLVFNNVISCNKEKPPVFLSCLSAWKIRGAFIYHYSQFVWVYPLINKSDVLLKFVLFRNYDRAQFKCEIRSFLCDHGGEFDNRNLRKLFAENGIQFRFSCQRHPNKNAPPTIQHTHAAQQPHKTDHKQLATNQNEIPPLIIPDLPENPNPVSVHPMVTRFRVGSNQPTQRLNLHVSSVSPLPRSYRDAFNDSNWQNVMRDEYNALIKNQTWTLVPRPPAPILYV
ncbi:ribonuclease H-like domain-containing protein, partial [Tanacetum coccineum]